MKKWFKLEKEEVDLILQFFVFHSSEHKRGKPNCCVQSFLCCVEIRYSNGPIHMLNRGVKEIKVELLCEVGSHLRTLRNSSKKTFKLTLRSRLNWSRMSARRWRKRWPSFETKHLDTTQTMLSCLSYFCFCFAFKLHKRNLPRKIKWMEKFKPRKKRRSVGRVKTMRE